MPTLTVQGFGPNLRRRMGVSQIWIYGTDITMGATVTITWTHDGETETWEGTTVSQNGNAWMANVNYMGKSKETEGGDLADVSVTVTSGDTSDTTDGTVIVDGP